MKYLTISFVNKNASVVLLATKPGNFFFDATVEAKLIAEGFDIPTWKKGTLLGLNGTQPLKQFSKVKNDTKYMTEDVDD